MRPAAPTEPRHSAPYLLFTLILSLLALVALVVQRATVSGEVRQLLEWFDLGVCVVFFVDFVISLMRAPDRWRYLRTWGWLDLLSSVPQVGVLRLTRSARIVRVVRLLRALRAARVLAEALTWRRAGSSLVTASLLGLVTLILGSVAILQVEPGGGEVATNIASAEDALWWSISTMTTVGYGDHYPVTTEGRLVGAVLMVVGVGLFGVLTAFLASLFVRSEETPPAPIVRELAELRREIGELKGMIERRG